MANEDFNYGANARPSAAKEMTLDEWTSYSSNEGGGGRFFSWKKDGRGDVTIWLVTTMSPQIFWHHNWPVIQEIEDRDGGGKRLEVWGERWGCHDAAYSEVLKKRNYRDKVTGEREYPPVRCPMDRVIEMVHAKVWAKELSWTEPLFRFEGDDPTQTRTMLAGGLYNAFSADDLTPDQKNELRRAGVRQDEAWMQDARAKCSFVFSCVVDGKLEEGAKIAIEGEALKNELRKEIEAMRKRKRIKDYSPLQNPYPFRLEYDKSRKFNERYTVTALEDVPSAEVLAAIRCTPPDVSEITVEGDPDKLLASMEEHRLVKLDFASCFGDGKARVQVPTGAPVGGAAKPVPTGAASTAKASVPATSGAKLYMCEHCGKATMLETDFTCPVNRGGCGAIYETTGEGSAKIVVMTSRPCTKCGTPIVLSASPQKEGEAGENVVCSKCGTIHHEVCIERTTRPCENPLCKAEVELKAGAACGTCGKVHELGEKDPQAAQSKSWRWEAVMPGAAPAEAAPRRGRRA